MNQSYLNKKRVDHVNGCITGGGVQPICVDNYREGSKKKDHSVICERFVTIHYTEQNSTTGTDARTSSLTYNTVIRFKNQ